MGIFQGWSSYQRGEQLFFGKSRFGQGNRGVFSDRCRENPCGQKFAGLKKWKIREKEGISNVARYVTGAYFGLPKYAPAFVASLFLLKT